MTGDPFEAFVAVSSRPRRQTGFSMCEGFEGLSLLKLLYVRARYARTHKGPNRRIPSKPSHPDIGPILEEVMNSKPDEYFERVCRSLEAICDTLVIEHRLTQHDAIALAAVGISPRDARRPS